MEYYDRLNESEKGIGPEGLGALLVPGMGSKYAQGHDDYLERDPTKEQFNSLSSIDVENGSDISFILEGYEEPDTYRVLVVGDHKASLHRITR